MRAHWPLLIILVVGLALRVPYRTQGHPGDILNFSRVATWMVTPGLWFDAYHLGYVGAFPYAHPPLGPLLFAPVNWFALRTGRPYVAAFHLFIYAFEAIATVVLYALARSYARENASATGAAAVEGARRRWDVGLPAFVAGFWFLGLLTPLWLGGEPGAPPDTQFTAVAATFILAALWRRASPLQAGVLFGLALATRTESALLAGAWTLYYLRKSWTEGAQFVFGAALSCGAIVLPFLLRDPVAFDWALRGHITERLGQDVPVLWRWLDADQHAGLIAVIQDRNTAIMALAIGGTTIAFRRDAWLERYLLLVGMAHILTMPVFHIHYGQYVLALAMAYVARAGLPLALSLWALVTARTGFTALTLGIPWLGLATQSLTAEPSPRSPTDPLRVRFTRWRRDGPPAPLWVAPAAAAAIYVALRLPYVSADPVVADPTGLSLLARALHSTSAGTGNANALLHVEGWLAPAAAGLPFGTLAWRMNVLPVALGAVAMVAAGCVLGWAWRHVRPGGEGHFVAAATALVAATVLLGTGREPGGESYHGLIQENLAALDRGALLCVPDSQLVLWQYAQLVDQERADVSVVAGTAEECATRAARSFDQRATYVAAPPLTGGEAQLVFFPAGGIWRAVAKRSAIADGAVLKGPEDRIYVVEHGERRWIPSMEAFTALGLHWEQVKLASYEELAAIPEGAPFVP